MYCITNKNTIVIAIFIIIVAGGAFFLFQRGQENSLLSSIRQQTSPIGGNTHVLSLTEDGFSPEEITIKKGQTVTWVNNTSEFRWPASNLHPTHTIYPAFDPREPIAPGDSWSFTFDKVGTWRYHDHLRPIDRGVIEVVE